MNVKTLTITLGIVIMIAMAIYPPWQSIDQDGKVVAMGYSFLWKPPEVQNKATGNLFGIEIDINLKSTRANSLDYGRLLIQEAVVALVVAGVCLLVGKGKKS